MNGDQPPRSLEERVTALEERLTYPEMMVTLDTPEITREDITRLEQALGEAVRQPLRVLPPRPLLTPETARALLRECVTVVQPGEILVLRVPDSWTHADAGHAQQMIRAWTAENAPGLKVLFVPPGEIAVAQPETDAQLAARVERVLPGILEEQARTAR